MNRILIVAAREFRQITGTRSFWLTLLILPIALAIGPLAQRFMGRGEPDRIMVIDRTGGGVAAAIGHRLALDDGRDQLTALSRYVARRHLDHIDPAAPWASHDRWYGDVEVERFLAGGGLPAALRRLRAAAPADMKGFTPPEPDATLVTPPPAIASVADARLDTALQPLLHPADKATKPVDAVVLVPASFGASPLVRLWTGGTPPSHFVAGLQDVLTDTLRGRFLAAHGLSPQEAAAAGAIAPTLAISTPPPGSGARERMLVRSVLPLAAAYMLMMSLMLSGSWMLQGTVEERSGKLLEKVLACVSPEELMLGKLAGLLGVGLSMIAVWIGCGLVAAYAGQGAIADFVRPALEPLTSPGVVAAMIYFFVVGYVSSAVFFLGIGIMSDSMRDAQGYLTPTILVLILPITVLMQAVLAGRGGIGLEVLTWVPIWTPFAVLARLGLGIPAWEVIGAGTVLALFVAIELTFLGRLFRASVLASGEKPTLRKLAARIARGT